MGGLVTARRQGGATGEAKAKVVHPRGCASSKGLHAPWCPCSQAAWGVPTPRLTDLELASILELKPY